MASATACSTIQHLRFHDLTGLKHELLPCLLKNLSDFLFQFFQVHSIWVYTYCDLRFDVDHSRLASSDYPITQVSLHSYPFLGNKATHPSGPQLTIIENNIYWYVPVRNASWSILCVI